MEVTERRDGAGARCIPMKLAGSDLEVGGAFMKEVGISELSVDLGVCLTLNTLSPVARVDFL